MRMDGVDELLGALGAHTDLGHAKRDGAFLRQVANMAEHPGGTASGGSAGLADAMSAYRFAGNPGAKLSALRAARLGATLAGVREGETVLLVNDVSVLNYYKHASKDDRRAVGDGKGKGYEYVCNLAVSLERGVAIGVLHDCLIAADGPDDADVIDYRSALPMEDFPEGSMGRLACNHKQMLISHNRHIVQNAPGVRLVTVADREFDDHHFFEDCAAKGRDFVIRGNALRNVQVVKPRWLPDAAVTGKLPGLGLLDGHVCAAMGDLVANVPVAPLKSVFLDAKGRLSDAGLGKEEARLSAGTFQVELYRDAKRDKIYVRPKKHVRLNVVVVKETEPPATGREPIQWALLTSLPVDTLEQVIKVVRIYELRWTVECLFKYLKSGFGIEELRFDSAGKTAAHLVVATVAATFLMGLKRGLGLSSGSRLSDEAYAEVKRASKNLNDASVDFDLRLFAFVAMQGKWFGCRANTISPSLLMKGMARVMAALEAFEAYPDFMREAAARFARRRPAAPS